MPIINTKTLSPGTGLMKSQLPAE